MSQRDRDREDNEGPRSFTRALEMIADGALVSEASTALHRLNTALQEDALDRMDTSKGELVIKLKLAVEPTGVVAVHYDVAAKEPKPHRPKGHLWMTKGGNLTPENPRQQKLPLREVGGEDRVREVEDKRGAAREV